jgi:hypothetical protein
LGFAARPDGDRADDFSHDAVFLWVVVLINF